MKKNFLLSALVLLFVALFALPANAQRPGGTRGSTTTTPTTTSRAETKPSATRTRTTSPRTRTTSSSRPQATTTRRTNPTPTTNTRRPSGNSSSTNRRTNPNYCPPGGTTATNRRRTNTQTTGNTRRSTANQGAGWSSARRPSTNANVRTSTVPANNRSANNDRRVANDVLCVCPTNRKGKVKKHKSTCEHAAARSFDDVYVSRAKRN